MKNNKKNEMRIAKKIALLRSLFRRVAEKYILDNMVKLNGKLITDPATNVNKDDVITINDVKIPDIEKARIWLYHKPNGYITSNRDELGRKTIFDNLPSDMPRVITIGRLDLNSEGIIID